MSALVKVDPAEVEDATERTRCWDAFLDAYSDYLREPGVTRAAALHLAGAELEAHDSSFCLADFEHRLGWSEALKDT